MLRGKRSWAAGGGRPGLGAAGDQGYLPPHGHPRPWRRWAIGDEGTRLFSSRGTCWGRDQPLSAHTPSPLLAELDRAAWHPSAPGTATAAPSSLASPAALMPGPRATATYGALPPTNDLHGSRLQPLSWPGVRFPAVVHSSRPTGPTHPACGKEGRPRRAGWTRQRTEERREGGCAPEAASGQSGKPEGRAAARLGCCWSCHFLTQRPRFPIPGGPGYPHQWQGGLRDPYWLGLQTRLLLLSVARVAKGGDRFSCFAAVQLETQHGPHESTQMPP